MLRLICWIDKDSYSVYKLLAEHAHQLFNNASCLVIYSRELLTYEWCLYQTIRPYLRVFFFLPISFVSGLLCQLILLSSSQFPVSLPASAPHHSALGSGAMCCFFSFFFMCIYLKVYTILDLPTGVVVRKYEAHSVNCMSSKPGEPAQCVVASDKAQGCGNRKSRLLG